MNLLLLDLILYSEATDSPPTLARSGFEATDSESKLAHEGPGRLSAGVGKPDSGMTNPEAREMTVADFTVKSRRELKRRMEKFEVWKSLAQQGWSA